LKEYCKPILLIYSKLCGGKLTRLFALKCLLIDYPISIILILGIYSTIILSYMLRIIEYEAPVGDRFIYPSTPSNQIKSFGDSLWCIYETFLTIGYGEFFPKTNIGRVICIFTALLGTFLVSLLAVTVQQYCDLKPREINVKCVLIQIVRFIDRVCYKEQIKKKASRYLALVPKIILLKSTIVNEVEKIKPDINLIVKKQAELKSMTIKGMRFKKRFMSTLQ
jgi:hypothetical protein